MELRATVSLSFWGDFNETWRIYDEMCVLYNDLNDIEAFFLVKAWNMEIRFLYLRDIWF